MKYVRYITIILISKVIGIFSIFWYWFIRDYRADARNIVYNYVLANNILLPYLTQYKFNKENMLSYDSDNGMIIYNHVSYVKYIWWKWIVWVWLDDNCENDTYNISNINNKPWYETNKKIIGKRLLKNTLSYSVNGSAFKLGDIRSHTPETSVINEAHHLYTSVSNYDHMYSYTNDKKYVFKFTIANREFGWVYYDTNKGKEVYKLVFNKKKY